MQDSCRVGQGAAAGPDPPTTCGFKRRLRLLSHGEPTSYFSAPATSAYDEDNRKISESDPADVNKKVYWS